MRSMGVLENMTSPISSLPMLMYGDVAGSMACLRIFTMRSTAVALMASSSFSSAWSCSRKYAP